MLPAGEVRAFATWFYQLMCRLLEFEINRDGIPAYQWEKKGSALFTTNNILQYGELSKATFRLMNRIEKKGGIIFYVGIQKTHSPEENNPKNLYCAVLHESITRLDQYCSARDAHFQILFDQQEDILRRQIVAEASKQMFGEAARTMIEPPIQAESHLFQTLQCADWLCGLIGRIGCYQVLPAEYGDLNWTEKYFTSRLRRVAPQSGIRRQKAGGEAARAD